MRALPSETTISITDDDDPGVTVSFGASTYTAAEGGTATVTVTLSADPERTVEVRITAANQNGATAADYSGGAGHGDLQRRGDMEAHHLPRRPRTPTTMTRESVKLAFGALPTGVTAGRPTRRR